MNIRLRQPNRRCDCGRFIRKLRESGKPTAAQVSELLAENIVFNSPILARPIEGREVIAAIFAQSSATAWSSVTLGTGSGSYTRAHRAVSPPAPRGVQFCAQTVKI